MVGDRPEVGKELRALRVSRRLSVSELAAHAGVARATIANWEAGSHAPRGAALGRLLDALEADARTRVRLLHATDPAFARIELSATGLGAPVHVGLVLRAMRRRRGMAQADLARAVDSTQPTVARWESGDLTPSAGAIHALCFALGATPEECAALTLGKDAGAAPVPDDPGEAAATVRKTIDDSGPDVYEVVSLGLEASLWARASRDVRWDAALCSVVSARSVKLFVAGRLDEAQETACRALRFDLTPAVRVAATQAVSALLEVATHRGADPARLAARINAWTERLPDGEFKAWMLWERALRLAEMGQDVEAVALTERMGEMNARATPSFPVHQHEFTRVNALLKVDVRSGRSDRAETRLPHLEAIYAEEARCRLQAGNPEYEAMLVIDAAVVSQWRVQIAHTQGMAADESDFRAFQHIASYKTGWYDRQKTTKLERTQAERLAAQGFRRPSR